MVKFSAFSFQTRLFLIIGLLALVQTTILGGFTLKFMATNLEDQIGKRALQMAKAVGQIPQIREGLENKDSKSIQPLAEAIRKETDARFIVVGDKNGIRYSHPLPERIGKAMVGGDNAPALEQGKSYISKAVGSLGPSMRGKAPIVNGKGEIIGLVSVGYMMDRVNQRIENYQSAVVWVALFSVILSMLAAIFISRYFKRVILGLEPEEIARLYEERNATLQSVREGIVAVDKSGVITTINKAAIETLDLESEQPLIGKHIHQVLPDSTMTDVLLTATPQFDRETLLSSRPIIVNRIPLTINGELTGVVSSFRRKDELDQLTQQLTQIQSYADMLRVQAHEYSNKLSTIAGLIQVGTPEQAIDFIDKESSGHQELIQFLVKAVPDPVLAGCLLGMYNRARELGLELIIDPDSSMGNIPEALPREQIVTLLNNLLDNAYEATLRQPQSASNVNFSMTDIGKELIFEIEDNGPGIAPEMKQRIFQQGVTTKDEDDHGIGLFLVRSILDQMQGDITFEDSDSGGTRTTLYIPKTRSESDA